MAFCSDLTHNPWLTRSPPMAVKKKKSGKKPVGRKKATAQTKPSKGTAGEGRKKPAAKLARKAAPKTSGVVAKKRTTPGKAAAPPQPHPGTSAARTAASRPTEQAWTPARIRSEWVDFFEKQGHLHVPSASLIPSGDPTLLFTTAGMVPFKGYFAGTEEPPRNRLVSIQKCFRTTDLESVGKTARHLTMFEMLGNFSFGDYFKREAIQFAYQFSVHRLKLDPKKIWVTVYLDDDEAELLWIKETGIPKERIRRLGKEANWWGPAGDSGACGPCSELYLDRGPDRCTCEDKAACGPGGSCDRYMEYWNLVFNQFHQDTSGKLHPLPKTGIDTGAGLERIAALLSGVESVYETSELARIIRETEELTSELSTGKKKVHYREENAAPFRVIADHVRSASFAISDGIFPDNTGRGYVIRRLIRRALLFAREIGISRPILYRLVPLVADIYGSSYPDVRNKKAEIEKRLLQEEERFLHTLELGIRRYHEYLTEHKKSKARVFSGESAFRLYDTYGFPLEMTSELAEREGLRVDLADFDKHMNHQREMASQASRWKDWNFPGDFSLDTSKATAFTGYDKSVESARVLALIKNETSPAEILEPGPSMIVLDRTPFYPEGGGQIGDTGRITSDSGLVFRVNDTRKKGDIIVHFGELMAGSVKVGDTVTAGIDRERREALMRHHSATHLLNHSLRKILGTHILQTGSLVSPDYLRFDFSHPERINETVLKEIELEVNRSIAARGGVNASVLPIEEARKSGAIATFGEKYGDRVRVIRMGGAGELSVEFCGGCHVANTGDIRAFLILKEASPGAGNRRIEAVAGDQVAAHFEREFDRIQAEVNTHNQLVREAAASLAENLSAASGMPDLAISESVLDPTSVRNAIDRSPLAVAEIRDTLLLWKKKLQDKGRDLQNARKAAAKQTSADLPDAAALIASAQKVGPVTVVVKQFTAIDIDVLRKLADAIKERERCAAVLFGTTGDKGPILIFMANKEAVAHGIDSGQLIRSAAMLIGGGGGGRPDMAQAGGKNADGLSAALAKAVETLKGSVR